jgi:Sec-independent protein translocase protein TatA
LAEYHDGIVGPELVILIIVLVVVIFWRGPSTLPKLGEALGKAVKGARDNMPGADDDKPESDSPVDPTDAGPRASS